MSKPTLCGVIVEYTNRYVTYYGENCLKLQIVFVGSFCGFVNETGNNDIILLNELGCSGSGVYRVAPRDDQTDDWGYFIVGDIATALRHLQNRIPGNFVLVAG